MRKFMFVSALAAAAVFILLSTVMAATRDSDKLEKMIDERNVVLWVEAVIMDDLVLNARGSLSIVMVDGKLGSALIKATPSMGISDATFKIPVDWLRKYGSNYARRSGHVLFAASVQSRKPWAFDTNLLSVGDYRIEESDVVKDVRDDLIPEIPAGLSELPSDFSGAVSFFVPAEYLKRGADVEIKYGEDSVVLKIPK